MRKLTFMSLFNTCSLVVLLIFSNSCQSKSAKAKTEISSEETNTPEVPTPKITATLEAFAFNEWKTTPAAPVISDH